MRVKCVRCMCKEAGESLSGPVVDDSGQKRASGGLTFLLTC